MPKMPPRDALGMYLDCLLVSIYKAQSEFIQGNYHGVCLALGRIEWQRTSAKELAEEVRAIEWAREVQAARATGEEPSP